MKYRNIFKTMEEYNSSSLSYPNISLITDDNKVIVSNKRTQPNNEIWYTSTDGNVVEVDTSRINPLILVSNTYEDGKGVLKFKDDITSLPRFCFVECYTFKTINLPNSLTTIGDSAFRKCENLIEINFSKESQLTTIANYGFIVCSKLPSIVIPKSVTSIGDFAFSDCYKLNDVYYDGTKEELKSISSNLTFIHSIPTTCIVHCSNGDYPISDFN